MLIAILLILIGVVFFAHALGYIDDVSLGLLWPLLLVALGFSMLSHRMFGHGSESWEAKPSNKSKKKK